MMDYMNKPFPGRPPRLSNIFREFNPPLYFITFCTFDRKSILANDAFHNHFVEHMKQKAVTGISCGEYVLMPDHVHFFLRIDSHRFQLGKTIGFIKQCLSKPLRDTHVEKPHWQPGFFDHVLRNAESYSDKWEYVRNNPLRAGLVTRAEDWKYQGVIVLMRY